MKIQILEVAHHRNGVSGESFYAVRFYPYRKPKERFLGIVFETPGQCAVIRSDLLETAGVEFGVNSWRGDDYEPALRAAVASFDEYDATLCAGIARHKAARNYRR